MDESTIPVPAGEAADCGRRLALALYFTMREAVRTGRRFTRFSCVRIRWPGDGFGLYKQSAIADHRLRTSLGNSRFRQDFLTMFEVGDRRRLIAYREQQLST